MTVEASTPKAQQAAVACGVGETNLGPSIAASRIPA